MDEGRGNRKLSVTSKRDFIARGQERMDWVADDKQDVWAVSSKGGKGKESIHFH